MELARGSGRRMTRRVSVAATVVGVLAAVVACGSSSTPTAATDASTQPAGRASVTSSVASSGGGSTTASASASVSAVAGGVVKPCTLVTPAILKSTIGTTVAAGKFEPTTVVGTGCRFTKVGTTASVNILIETTDDPANQLSALAYSAPAGSSSVRGSDRGYVVAPAVGTSTGAIMIVKGGAGVFVTLFQNAPPLTLATEQKLAAAIVSQL